MAHDFNHMLYNMGLWIDLYLLHLGLSTYLQYGTVDCGYITGHAQLIFTNIMFIGPNINIAVYTVLWSQQINHS